MKIARLGDVASINPRGESVASHEPVSFVGMKELDAETAIARPLTAKLFHEVSKGYTMFRHRDLLVAKITPCWENGKIGQAWLEHPVGVGSTEFHVVRPGHSVDERYLLHFLRQPTIRAAGRLRMTGSGGQRRVPGAYLHDLRLPLPAIDEQRRVAAILDQADTLRAKRRQVLAHLDALIQSIFSLMFGDPISEAEGSTVDDMADIQIGPFGSLLHREDYVVDGVPLINPTHIVNGTIEPVSTFSVTADKAARLQSYRLRAGDVVMGRRGEMGRCAVVGTHQDGYLCGTGSLIVRPRHGISPIYLQTALSHSRTRRALENRSLGSTLPNLNAKIVEQLPLLLPSIGPQQQFETRMCHVKAQHTVARHAVDVADQLFSSLQSRVFRGEL